MNPSRSDADMPSSTAAFFGWVQQALNQLNDLNLLQRHPLARELQPAQARSPEEAGLVLRGKLVDAIEALKPVIDVPANAQHMRTYSLLRAHYVDGITIEKAGERLNISLRQSYRDLRRGEEKVAELLWLQRHEGDQPPAVDDVALQGVEAALVEPRCEPIALRGVLERAVMAVNRLAALNAVAIELAPDAEVVICTDPSAAHQVFVGLMSHAVQHAQPGSLHMQLTPEPASLSLQMSYAPRAPRIGENQGVVFDPAIVTLAHRLGWSIDSAQGDSGQWITRVHIPERGANVVLVIDDNEGLGRLLERYLTGERCRVMQAVSAADGLRLASEYRPDAIVLDIMMPEVDGWEILQTLRNQPRTAGIPVIVCSVVNDPELAFSLGAAQIWRKPITQDDVIGMLRRLNVV